MTRLEIEKALNKLQEKRPVTETQLHDLQEMLMSYSKKLWKEGNQKEADSIELLLKKFQFYTFFEEEESEDFAVYSYEPKQRKTTKLVDSGVFFIDKRLESEWDFTENKTNTSQ